jgi:hypothetical protein
MLVLDCYQVRGKQKQINRKKNMKMEHWEKSKWIIEILERGLTEKTLRYWEAGLPSDGLVELAIEEAGEPEQCLDYKIQSLAESQLNILCSEKVKQQIKQH